MTFPMVWESDLHEWLHDWKGQRLLKMDGLKPNMPTQKREEGVFCAWQRLE
jgi:hypothetical protein